MPDTPEPTTTPDQPPADHTAAQARRERYATAISKWHRDPEQPLYTQGAEAVIAIADAEQAELRRERDLAIAHDRQPYPTAWAYEQACKALHKHRDRADAAEAALDRIRQMADYWERQLPEVIRTPAVVSAIRAALERVNGPSRVAAEEQPAETQAHPSHDSWLVEWRAKDGDWAVAYPTHDHSKALDRLARGRQEALDWQWRLVRETTTYTVEAEHTPPTARPAVGEQPETQEADRA